VAVLSDVHGNRWALEAVFEDLSRGGVRRVLNLGDCLYGPLDPAATARLLMDRDIPTVRGNEDRLVVEPPCRSGDSPTLAFVRERLDRGQLRWLESLPLTLMTEDGLFLCHGSPRDDAEYLLFEVTREGARARAPREVQALLGRVPARLALCGHDHLQATAALPDGRLVVNPGSVGLPAYADDLPFPHVMETGTPHARYSLLDPVPGGWSVEHRKIEYDWEAAARAAERNGRPDWARALRSGRAA
jgi:predicted phosphodiesterase